LPIADTNVSLSRWALWFSAITGLGQALLIYVLRLATGRLIHVSDHVVWMAPVANMAIFGLAALVVHFLTRRKPRSHAIGTAWTVFVIAAGLGPAFLVERLHPIASVLLLTGVAIQTGAFVRAHADWVDRVIRKTLPVLLVLIVVLGAGQVGLRAMNIRRIQAAQPPAAAGAPNVLLIVLDTVRASSMSLYGHRRHTSPHLDRFAAEGVTFDRALSTSPWTLPSHATMFTGRLPHELSADWQTPLDGTHRTLAEALTARGYATVGSVANLIYTIEPTGLSRGFQAYLDFPLSAASFFEQSWVIRPVLKRLPGGAAEGRLVKKSAAGVNAEFLDWVDSRPTGRPFFAFLNYFDAHNPYDPPAPFDTKFSSGPMPDEDRRLEWSPAEIQRSLDAYESTIAYLDEQLGHLIEDLRSRHLLDNTLIVITSDHGEQFGEHRLFDHGNALYRQVLHVPLIFRLPSTIPNGVRISEAVSLVDLPSTILSIAGAGSDAFPGRSLEGHWQPMPTAAAAAHPLFAEISKGINLAPWQPASKGRMRTVILDGVQYFLNGDGTEELYDFDNDPHEKTNLIARPEMQAKLAAARKTLADLR
jgi:arylsulfatase A-like enzyme